MAMAARHARQGIATALVGAMAALTIAGHWLPHTVAADLLRAGAKAGFVGGMADWFAVVALFRRPMGLPIPHTAILPRQQARLARAFGRFVADHVFTEAELSRAVARFDIPARLGRLLADPAIARPLGEAAASALPRLLDSVEDGRVRALFSRLLPRLLGGTNTGRIVAQALRALLASGRHQDVLTFLIDKLRGTLAEKETDLRGMIEDRVREQGGRLVGWAIGASIASRVLSALNGEIGKVDPDGSELRIAFETWIRAEIDRLESDPARAAEIGRAVRKAMSDDAVQAWLWDLWLRFRQSLHAGSESSHDRVAAFAQSAMEEIGRTLQTDIAMQRGLQATADHVARFAAPLVQRQLSVFITDAVGRWESTKLVQRLEASVGSELQWIRINGTIVGFLIGALAYLAMRFSFGADAG